jgi:hypothetical protein
MAQPKYTIYKYVRFKDGSWRYCRAALYANHTIKRDVVTVGGREEKHPEGNYYIACAGEWIPAGPDALKAQRQQHALLSGNSLEYDRFYLSIGRASRRVFPHPLRPVHVSRINLDRTDRNLSTIGRSAVVPIRIRD